MPTIDDLPSDTATGTEEVPVWDVPTATTRKVTTQAIADLSGSDAELDAHVTDAAAAHAASAVSFTPAGTIAATTVQAAIEEVATEAGGGGAPTTADYLVGTAQAGLSAEIVVGATPGGELGGTWASPTVDPTHSGSAHADKIDKATLDANSVLYATADDTPAALAMAASTILARLASGNIVAATPAQLKTLLAIVSGDVSDFTEAAQDAVGAALTDTATIDLTYNDGANTITGAVLDSPTVAGATPAQLRDRSTHTGTQTAATISDFTEVAQDAAGSLLADSATLDVTYNDAGNAETAAVLDSPKINGITVTGTPSTGQVPTATGTTAATWQTLGTATVTLVITPGLNGVVGDGATNDTTAINAILATIPRTATRYGCDVVIRGGNYLVSPNSIKFEVANTRVIFEGGATFTCPSAASGDRIIHIAQWYIDVIGQPRVTGSAARGNGIGIGIGPSSTTRYPTSIGADDSGVHGCLVASPSVSNCEAGVEFAIGANGNSGDNLVEGGRIASCKDGIRSVGFTNAALGTYIQDCDYGVRQTSGSSSSGRIDCTDLTIADCYQAPVAIEKGSGSVFRGLWIEQAARTAALGLIVNGTSSTAAYGTRFEGPTNIHFYTTPEDYGVKLVNGSNFYMEDAVLSVSSGAAPNVALMYLDSTCTGRNNVINRAYYKNGVVPAGWTHAKALTRHGSATGQGVVRQAPEVAGAATGTMIGPLNPTVGADYTVGKSVLGTYYAVTADGHITSAAADSGSLPASYVTGTLPAGTGITSGQQTTSGLATVLAAIQGSTRHIAFTAGVFAFGLNRGWILPTNVVDLVLSGVKDKTFLQNFTTGGGDTEPLSFGGATGCTVRDLVLSAGGDYYGGGSGISGDSCDALDLDSAKNCVVEGVKVIAARDRGIIFDGGNTTSTTNVASSYDNVVRRCTIDGTRPVAPTGTPTATAVAGGTLTSRAYTYRVTQILSDYRESVSLLISGTVTPSGTQQVTITKPTLAATAIGWKIYRASTTGTTDEFRMVAAIFDLSLTSFTDNCPDDSTGINYNGSDSTTPTKYIPELSVMQAGTVRVGMQSLAAQRITFENNDIQSTASAGIVITSKNNTPATARVRPDNCWITSNRIRGSQGSGMSISGGFQTQIHDNLISNCGQQIAVAQEVTSTAAAVVTASAISLTRASASTFGENQYPSVLNNSVRDDQTTPTTLAAVSTSTTNGGPTSGVVRNNDWQGQTSTSGISDGAGVATTFIYEANTAAETKTSATSTTVNPYERTFIATAATQTVTLPNSSGRAGRRITVQATNASPTVTIAAQAGENIRGSASITVQYGSRTYVSDGGTQWILEASV